MSYSNSATAYRDRDVQTASPARLVVLVFDHALANLFRVRRSLETGNIQDRVTAVGKVRDAILELLVTLDTEQGGEIAQNLKSLYTYVLTELADVVPHPDAAQIERLTRIVTELRTAFATIAETARVPAA